MTSKDLLDKQIEEYIHNRMSAEERVSFENILRDDLTLRNQVYDLIMLISLYNKELFQLKKKLAESTTALERNNFFDDNSIPSS